MANAKALWSEQAWVPKAAGSEGLGEGGPSATRCLAPGGQTNGWARLVPPGHDRIRRKPGHEAHAL